MFARLLAYVRARLGRRNIDAEIDDELRFHLEMEMEIHRARGLSAAEARRAALRGLGGMQQTREAVGAVRALGLDAIGRDLTYALRRLGRERGFTATALLTLTLGIGTSLAGVSFAYGLSWRPIPGVADPDRVVRLQLPRADGRGWGSFDAARLGELDSLERLFSGASGYVEQAVDVSVAGQPARARAVFAAPGYFETMGVRLALGRLLASGDEVRHEAIISDRFWRERFGGSDAAMGATLFVNGHAFTVVGVAPRGFIGVGMWWEAPGPREASVWLPSASKPLVTGGPARIAFDPIARLQPGVRIEEAVALLEPIAGRWEAERAEQTAYRLVPTPLQPGVPSAALFHALMAGLAIPAVVLLVACANLASLVLARSLGRAHEVATRRALGASRWDIVRQRLVEALVLGCGGGLLGLAGAYWASRWFVAQLRMPGIELGPDPAILTATAAISLVAVLLFGLLPALATSQTPALAALRAATGAGTLPRGAAGQRALVVAQVALSLMLVASGAAVLRTVERLAAAVQPGFDVSPSVLTASIDLDPHPYSADERRLLLDEIRQRVAALADVEAAAFAEAPPFVRRLYYGGTNDEARPRAFGVRVSSGYFQTLGLPLVRGRDFSVADRAGAPRVAIVTEEMARTFWPDDDAIGRSFSINTSGAGGPRDAAVSVVGVAADVDLSDRRPGFYLPFEQHMGRGGFGWEQVTLLVRGRNGRAPSLPVLREEMRQVDSRLSLFDVLSVRALADRLTDRERGMSTAMTALGLATLVLAVTGTFGVMALAAGQRRREAGIRLALGARPSDITRLGLRDGGRLVSVGIALGLLLALVASRALGSMMLPGTAIATEAIAAVVALVTAAVLLACYLPARRAARVDPAAILRTE